MVDDYIASTHGGHDRDLGKAGRPRSSSRKSTERKVGSVASVAPCTAKPNDEFVDCGAPQKSRPTRFEAPFADRFITETRVRRGRSCSRGQVVAIAETKHCERNIS